MKTAIAVCCLMFSSLALANCGGPNESKSPTLADLDCRSQLKDYEDVVAND
jgi:hypothetical protein